MNRKAIVMCTAAIASALSLGAIGCEGEVHTHSAYYDREPDRTVVRREVVVEQAPPPRREVVVVEPPPPARVEVVRESRPGYVWIPGYYRHDGRQYVWVEGRWDRPPRPNNHWEAGHWDHRSNGYIWIEGRWN